MNLLAHPLPRVASAAGLRTVGRPTPAMLPTLPASTGVTLPVLLAYTLAGATLGSASGLVPGLHANNFAMVLAAGAATLPGPPLAVGAAMLAAGVVHTFLDVVPTLALGVPDPAMAAGALPGHRLVIAGRGREALRLSALGSGVATVGALAVAVPLTAGMRVAYPVLRSHLPLVLGAVAVVLVASEPSWRARVAGAGTLALATALGWATLDLSPAAPLPVGGTLTPLFAGLFGVPILLDAADGAGVPPQDDPVVATAPRLVLATAGAGTAAAAMVGYLPGVSAGVAAVIALPLTPGRAGDRGYVVTTSGANTATTVFALFALAAFDAPRTGVLVAYRSVGAPVVLATLVAVVVLAAAWGTLAVLLVGDRYLRWVGRLDYRRLSVAVLCLLAAVSFLFAGATGLVILAAASLLGLLPVRLGVKRVHLMGVLIGPLALA